MKGDRKVVEREILYFIDMFRPGSNNKKIYEELFARMNDKEFEEWMERLEAGEVLALYAPNLEEPQLSINQNYKVADALGHELFQHLILTDPQTGQTYKTQNKHLVGLVPFRRQVQMLVKKSSIPGSNHIVDERSGQAAGDSKGARLSAPEIQVNASKGLNNMVLELIKFRGGDEKAYNAMNKSIIETGEASLDSIMAETPSQTKSNLTLSVYLKGMHLNNNLAG
ncbi:RNA polymerase beta subunit [Pseudomonas phage PhiPA3]|uniref:Virion structural protein n=1 Tax=Pseudomonas phage PhiPA3 TaxID=998086 RepID=F8SK45_BPPA3|nr:RNA polymerase beta subunit [Pseudomonas phage PhiPA3]AEH03595.1 virion structural protein [Pseudomonas phage PhiPA3]